MKYTNPETVISPKTVVSEVNVLLNMQGEGGWSLAELTWNGNRRLGIRWNGDESNPLGNPQSRGIATWFVLPDEIASCLEDKFLAPGYKIENFPTEIKRLRIRPLPRRIQRGKEQEKVDYDWAVANVDHENGKLHVVNTATGHYLVLYSVHVNSVVPDPTKNADGFKHAT